MPAFYIAMSLVVLIAASDAWGSVGLHGRVVEAGTGRPLPRATVTIPASGLATYCDSAGYFVQDLPPGTYQLEVSYIGYQVGRRSVTVGALKAPVLVELVPRVIELTEAVMVYGDSELDGGQRRLTVRKDLTTDTVLDGVEGVDLVRRGPFGLDPVIRGTHAGQVGIAIDGMKVFSACVDHMDPVSSYVEIENLEQLEVAKGAFDLTQGQAVGGTINLITKKPTFGRPLSGRAEMGYESVARHRFNRSVLNLARDDLALRGSFSYRRADDFKPGGRPALANSQFAKYNFKVDLAKKGRRHQVGLSVLGDRAWDIGYPALLMDASQAQSFLFSAEHTWTGNGSRLFHRARTRFYTSRVDHWMDDEKRDVSRREVMRGMNMPMYGKTRTWGLLESFLLTAPKQTLELVVDLYRLDAFADMEMISLDPETAPMYLLNLGDIRRYHLALTADYNHALGTFLQWKTNLRFDRANQDILDPRGRRQLAATWGSSGLERHYSTLSLSTVFEYVLRSYTRLKLSLASSARLPTAMENYGFFLFNPVDGYFYIGNPSLEPEHSRQLELGIEYSKGGRQLSLNLYYNHMSDYIAGVVRESIFKNYANISTAYIYGTELSALLPLSEHLLASAAANYTYGQNSAFDEPLPFVSPLEGRFSLSYERRAYWFEVGARAVARQGRIARRTTLEDPTPGFVVFGVSSKFALNGTANLKLGVENIFNRFYYEHLSVENFPSPGRNFTAALDIDF